MIIIVDSGATKTEWCSLADDGQVIRIRTSGLSPTCLDEEHFRNIIRSSVPLINPDGQRVSEVHFYGAGLVSHESSAVLESCLSMWCPFARIYFYSDILAAARAVFGDGSGVVAIMGTGSNSCLYQNGSIVRNIKPGGYVLGDEGSGVALGKAFLADFVKGLLPEHIESEFVREFALDYPAIVRKVYKEPGASAFMASMAPFVLARYEDPYVRSLVDDCLESFVKRVLVRYSSCLEQSLETRTVGVIGSFGCACRDILCEIGRKYGLEFIGFMKSPIDGLIRYHGV